MTRRGAEAGAGKSKWVSYKMVRSLTGFLMEVGIGRVDPEDRFWKSRSELHRYASTAGTISVECDILKNGRRQPEPWTHWLKASCSTD